MSQPIGMLEITRDERNYLIEAAQIRYIDELMPRGGEKQTVIWLKSGAEIRIPGLVMGLRQQYEELVNAAKSNVRID